MASESGLALQLCSSFSVADLQRVRFFGVEHIHEVLMGLLHCCRCSECVLFIDSVM